MVERISFTAMINNIGDIGLAGKYLRAEIANWWTLKEAMVRATIRCALDGILRRSKLLEQIYRAFSSVDLLGFATQVAYHEECI